MWPGPRTRTVEHVAGAGLDPIPRAEQKRRVEIALERRGPLRRATSPSSSGYAPVEPDHVATRGGHRAQQMRGPGAEVNRRHVERREDARRVRRDELGVVGDRERAHPGVEELHDVCAGICLRSHVRSERVGELVTERMPHLRLLVHQRLDLGEVPARLPSTR
jgi:hypothetical protein